MTVSITLFTVAGVLFAALGTAAQVDALWIRHHPKGPKHSSLRSLTWACGMGLRLLFSSFLLQSRKRMFLPHVQEAGGVALRFFGAVFALAAALLVFNY